MHKLPLLIKDETSTLEVVILGNPIDFGGVPSMQYAYDPKSKEHIVAGTFPIESDLIKEMEQFRLVLEKYDIEVYRPENIKNYNQIFSRDIAFVIDDTLIVPNILEERSKEYSAISHIVKTIDTDNIIKMPEGIYVEGGDVMPWDDCIFVGVSNEEDFHKYKVARTNYEGVAFLQKTFPERTVVSFELNKSDTDPRANALHLDCCFQPIGNGQALLHPGGFKNEEDIKFLIDYFGSENIIELDREEVYEMSSNVFSISSNVIVSDKRFVRLNKELRIRGFIVEEIEYKEVGKMSGLLRCSTLPLRRTNNE